MGRPLSLPEEGWQLLQHPHPLAAAYWRQLFTHLWDIVLPFSIGGMALSVVLSLAAYPVTLKLLRARQRNRVNDEVGTMNDE
jgi:hypothetical protein